MKVFIAKQEVYFTLASKEIFNHPRYLWIFLGLALLFFWVLVYIPVRSIPGNDFLFQLSILTVKDWILFITLSVLTALSVVFNIYLLFLNKRRDSGSFAHKNKVKVGAALTVQGGTGILSGIVASLFGTATCAACISSLFGFLGFGGVLFLIEYRTPITVAAILLLLVSLHFTSQKVLRVCKICKV